MKPLEIKNGVTIIGGTGTLGTALLKTITEEWPKIGVTVISRDEHKQAKLKRDFPNVRFAIGDIRDYDSIAPFIHGRELIFHVAALKHVDVCEKNPIEAIKTNVLGTENVARACLTGGVKHMIFSSTDKAVEPITQYGACKLAAENLLYNYNKSQTKTKFAVYRWGNVLGSQGSVIPYFVETLTKERKAYITHREMTRFWLPIDWAVTYMLRTFQDAKPNKAMIPPNLKSALVKDVIDTLAFMLDIRGYIIQETGIREVEKLHEVMVSESDYRLASNTSELYTREELIRLLSPFVPSFSLKEAA
jgi:UDP-N-acetylglucosamine 4,6-dehydratase